MSLGLSKVLDPNRVILPNKLLCLEHQIATADEQRSALVQDIGIDVQNAPLSIGSVAACLLCQESQRRSLIVRRSFPCGLFGSLKSAG